MESKIKLMDKSNDYIKIKQLERFRYLKDMVQSKQEIHSAIMVLRNERKKNGVCEHPLIDGNLRNKLIIRTAGSVCTLLSEFKYYLENTK